MNQRIIGWILAVAIVVLVLFNLGQGDFLLAGVSVMLFFLPPMIARPDLCWIATIITLASGISFGVVGGASLHLVFMLSFIGVLIMKLAVSSRHAPHASVPRKACGALIIVIIVTAMWRGVGFKFLDSASSGGMQYVNILAALLFYLYSAHVTISQQQLGKTVWWLFMLSLIPAAGFLLEMYLPSMKWLENVLPSAEIQMEWQASEGVRWVTMQSSAIWMGIMAMYLYDRNSKFTLAVYFVSALSFVMLGLSGHRAAAVLLGLTVCVYLTIKRREVRLLQYLKLASVIILLVAILYLFIGELPRTFQRALAWLPGIDVTYEVGMDASSTSIWRIELWRQLIPMIPDYLWIGRGLAFNQIEAQSASMLASDVEIQHVYFTAVHLYHSGPLLLILDLGLMGFVAGVVFMLGGIWHYGLQLFRIPKDPQWNAAYVVIYCFFVGECIFFLAVSGPGGSCAQFWFWHLSLK